MTSLSLEQKVTTSNQLSSGQMEVLTRPCIKYISNKLPVVDDFKYENETYPHIFCLDPCYSLMFPPIIQDTSLDRIRYVSVTLKNDDSFIKNKFIMSVIYLQCEYVQKLVDKTTIKTLETCMYVLTSFFTYYHFCVNTEKYLLITNTILDRMKSLTSLKQYIDQWVKNIEKNVYQFDNVKINKDNLLKSQFKCVDNAQSMITLLNEYYIENDEDKKCKYCMSSLPKNRLVRPCKCTDPVHIECFKTWLLSPKLGDRNKCEICNDEFSRLNEKRNGCDESNEIFFPFDNVYPVLLMSQRDVEKISEENEYVFALCYLQCARMIDLFENKKDKKPGFGDMLKYFLDGSMPSNYLIVHNRKGYSDMKQILKKYSII